MKILQVYYIKMTFILHYKMQLKTGANYAILITGCSMCFLSYGIRKDEGYVER